MATKNRYLRVHENREVQLVMTPGGRVGYVKARSVKAKRITIRFIDARDSDDEVTVDEKLPGLRLIRLRARDVFRKEAQAGRYSATGPWAKQRRTSGIHADAARSAARAP